MITNSKILLRFLVIFFGLQAFPFPLDRIPFLEKPSLWLESLFEKIVLFISNQVLQISTESPVVSGSGDKHYNYVFLLIIFLIAILGTSLWTVIENKSIGKYKKINYWFWVYLRFYLASILLTYGFVKFFPLQMPAPSFSRLITPYGNFSPMGVAWSFIGTSTGYQIFSGAAEIIAGLLLLHRRTSMVGSLIAIGVLSNVVALNFFYDIPVKIFSSLLFLIAIMIFSPHARRFFKFLFGRTMVEPIRIFNPILHVKWNIWKDITKWIVIGAFLVWSVHQNYQRLYSSYGPFGEKPPLYGLFEIENFSLNGEVRPPLLTDSLRWRYLVSEYPGRMAVYDMQKKATWLKSKVDTLERKIILSSYKDTNTIYTLNYRQIDSILFIEGLYKGDTISLKSNCFKKSDFPLIKRKFNWVQEYPYNR